MSRPAPIVECVPVISGAHRSWTFFSTDLNAAGIGQGRCRLADFSSAAAARQFGREAQLAGNRVRGPDQIIRPDQSEASA